MKMMHSSSDWLALQSTSFSGTFAAMCPEAALNSLALNLRATQRAEI
jgi:hypothetical protein